MLCLLLVCLFLERYSNESRSTYLVLFFLLSLSSECCLSLIFLFFRTAFFQCLHFASGLINLSNHLLHPQFGSHPRRQLSFSKVSQLFLFEMLLNDLRGTSQVYQLPPMASSLCLLWHILLSPNCILMTVLLHITSHICLIHHLLLTSHSGVCL